MSGAKELGMIVVEKANGDIGRVVGGDRKTGYQVKINGVVYEYGWEDIHFIKYGDIAAIMEEVYRDHVQVMDQQQFQQVDSKIEEYDPECFLSPGDRILVKKGRGAYSGRHGTIIQGTPDKFLVRLENLFPTQKDKEKGKHTTNATISIYDVDIVEERMDSVLKPETMIEVTDKKSGLRGFAGEIISRDDLTSLYTVKVYAVKKGDIVEKTRLFGRESFTLK